MEVFSENERGQASAKMWLANSYVKDLIEFKKGDVNRFGRMVDGRGVSVASPALWMSKLANIAQNPAVKHFYADSINDLVNRAVRLGFELPQQESK